MGVLDLAVGVVAESGAGVLQRHGVCGVGGGEGVPGADGVLHEALPALTSVHGFLVLDLGLCAAHFCLGWAHTARVVVVVVLAVTGWLYVIQDLISEGGSCLLL